MGQLAHVDYAHPLQVRTALRRFAVSTSGPLPSVGGVCAPTALKRTGLRWTQS